MFSKFKKLDHLFRHITSIYLNVLLKNKSILMIILLDINKTKEFIKISGKTMMEVFDKTYSQANHWVIDGKSLLKQPTKVVFI